MVLPGCGGSLVNQISTYRPLAELLAWKIWVPEPSVLALGHLGERGQRWTREMALLLPTSIATLAPAIGPKVTCTELRLHRLAHVQDQPGALLQAAEHRVADVELGVPGGGRVAVDRQLAPRRCPRRPGRWPGRARRSRRALTGVEHGVGRRGTATTSCRRTGPGLAGERAVTAGQAVHARSRWPPRTSSTTSDDGQPRLSIGRRRRRAAPRRLRNAAAAGGRRPAAVAGHSQTVVRRRRCRGLVLPGAGRSRARARPRRGRRAAGRERRRDHLDQRVGEQRRGGQRRAAAALALEQRLAGHLVDGRRARRRRPGAGCTACRRPAGRAAACPCPGPGQ